VGNQESDGISHNFTYDAEGNVTAVDSGSTATYVYDALNHRVRTVTSAGTYEYDFDAQGRRISKWQTSNNSGIEGRIYWGATQVAFRAINGQTFFEHQSYLGTERLRTNYQGSTAATEFSLAYGDDFNQTVPIPYADQDNSQFAGQDYDSESSSQHALFRQYSSTQGRWMSPDPYDGSYELTNPQSFNRYSYARNSPVGFTDALGLDPAEDAPVCDATSINCGAPTPGCEPDCTDQYGTTYNPNGNGGIAGGDGGNITSSGCNPTDGCYQAGSIIFYGIGSSSSGVGSSGGRGGSSTPSSSNAPSKPGVGTCLAQAASDGRGLALAADIVGDVATGFAIANPASSAAILVGLAATSVGTLNAINHFSWSGGAVAGVNQTVASTGVLTHGLEIGSFIRAGTAFSKGLTAAGIFGSVVSTVSDATAAISAYRTCRAGG
jgi:RHS repeat-associated protein